MTVYHEKFGIETGMLPAFVDVTAEVKAIVERSKVTNGIALIFSQHTTCSVMVQEESFDETYAGIKYIHQDLLDIFDKLIPICKKEGQYMHPGPKLVAHAEKYYNEPAPWCLNTDAHLRSALLGRSQSMPILDGHLEVGEFGHIYFVDFDVVRPRTRTVRVQIVGE